MQVDEVSEKRPSSTTALISYVPSVPIWSMMPFKLGFEFQEITGLCPWAKGDSRAQKKKLFEVFDGQNGTRL